ncbi:MotA/TolQ/ExbB proton channel family protein [Coraliomargarita algicola]|uniref:MotA/TolQ/ExbB proton channel family protein n=1 Tax=Coraliomargarita algicola TaxID=3092156 RepID=A0ABZ0RSI6_9BACT|nr:MotA/TolQ/ExbB proton channel family protein [Coraliomargarita sp. J2-16]WPJ98033.1 MotA/TolQ/ExbB proton channel family protein [Coraliomargarita sp. J2-16]
MNTLSNKFHRALGRFSFALGAFVTCAGGAYGQAEVAVELALPVENITLWAMFQQGGWAMYPLLAFSVATVGLASYCALIIKEKRFTQPEATDDLRAAIEGGDIGAGLSACEAHPGYMTDILRLGFQTVEEGYNSVAEVNEALEERAGKVLAGPLVFVQYLQVVASVSPMMGLLGTVSGMVKAFRNIAAQGLGKPELLANNISEALVTTASGLLIAIPALMFYFYFKNKYMAASSGIYERLGEMTRLMKKNGMVSDQVAS